MFLFSCVIAVLVLCRFRAIVEVTKPERPDSTVTLKGLDYVDVLALTKRDYKISFFSYKECQYNAKVVPNTTTFCLQFYQILRNIQINTIPKSSIHTHNWHYTELISKANWFLLSCKHCQVC